MPRQKSFLKGRIVFNNGLNSADCLIRDFNEQGARLKFFGAVATPEVIELHIPIKSEVYRARVQWRVADEAGVAFELEESAPPLVPGMTPDWAARIRKLEQDVAALQRKFNELQLSVRQSQSAE